MKPRQKHCSSGTPPFVVTNNYRTAWKAYQHTHAHTHQHCYIDLSHKQHTHANMQALILLLFYSRCFFFTFCNAVTYAPPPPTRPMWLRYSPSCALHSPCNVSCPPPWWSTDWPRRFRGNSQARHTHRLAFASLRWDGVWRRRFRRTPPSYCCYCFCCCELLTDTPLLWSASATKCRSVRFGCNNANEKDTVTHNTRTQIASMHTHTRTGFSISCLSCCCSCCCRC